MALKILCLFSTEIKTIGTSVKGSICFLIKVSNSLAVFVSFSTKSHLLTKMTIPLRFRWANQKIFCTCPSKPRVASKTSKHTSECSIALTLRITE